MDCGRFSFAYVSLEGALRLLIHQTDARAIQLAKAALYAGAKLLMERTGAKPERVTLASAGRAAKCCVGLEPMRDSIQRQDGSLRRHRPCAIVRGPWTPT
jgi:hypothetical protein